MRRIVVGRVLARKHQLQQPSLCRILQQQQPTPLLKMRVQPPCAARFLATTTTSSTASISQESSIPKGGASSSSSSSSFHFSSSQKKTAAVAFACLSLGFACGRWSSAEQPHEHHHHEHHVLPSGLPRTCCDKNDETTTTTTTKSSSSELHKLTDDQQALFGKLCRIMGKENVLHGRDDERTRAQTLPFLKGARLGHGSCLYICTPTRLQHAVDAVTAIVEANCVVLPQGQNTGLTGGSVPRSGGSTISTTTDDRPIVVLSMKHLNRMFPIDNGERMVCVFYLTIHD
jgi:D-lactate dehydrogenase (quinone)